MRNKKFLSVLLATAMVFTMNTAVFADNAVEAAEAVEESDSVDVVTEDVDAVGATKTWSGGTYTSSKGLKFTFCAFATFIKISLYLTPLSRNRLRTEFPP